MLKALRHLLAILLLPFVVVVVVPCWLLCAFSSVDTRWKESTQLALLALAAGIVFLVIGFVLFSCCVSLFVRIGRGTLAPWDPTRNLVAVGPYRFVRNPMISGVLFMLLGEALLWGSSLISFWAALFVLINHIYFVRFEEPGLEERFGESYRQYKMNVPRWIPRLRPWSAPRGSSS